MNFLSSLVLLIITSQVRSRGTSTAERPRYQRLMQPSSGSKLTLTPGVTTPSMQLNTIESLFSMKMPISVKFPTLAQTAQSFIASAFNGSRRYPAPGSDPRDDNKLFQSRLNSRARFYETVEKSHKVFGKACLLRAICEVAEVPFVSSSTGILGELFDLLLTSSFLGDKSARLAPYRKAEQVGKNSFVNSKQSCKQKYKSCPFSLFRIMEFTNDVLF